MIFIPIVLLIGIAVGWMIATARGAGSAPWISEHRPGEADRRLARMEQAAEETVRAVERLEEGQRFLLAALTDRQHTRALPETSSAAPDEPGRGADAAGELRDGHA